MLCSCTPLFPQQHYNRTLMFPSFMLFILKKNELVIPLHASALCTPALPFYSRTKIYSYDTRTPCRHSSIFSNIGIPLETGIAVVEYLRRCGKIGGRIPRASLLFLQSLLMKTIEMIHLGSSGLLRRFSATLIEHSPLYKTPAGGGPQGTCPTVTTAGREMAQQSQTTETYKLRWAYRDMTGKSEVGPPTTMLHLRVPLHDGAGILEGERLLVQTLRYSIKHACT